MPQVSHTPNHAASIRLARVASHLHQAGKQLAIATRGADRYHRQRLRRLLDDLRELSLPIASLVSSLTRGGGR